MNPTNEPQKTRGRETPNQSRMMANMVVNGTAPADFSPQMKKFKTKNTVKTTPGTSVAVKMVLRQRSDALNSLQKKALF